ncbi:MAG TPA: hypothetical protein PKZ93_00450 [Spirochaetota bacterium]|nr:hypothetical protein [Spirochaetota bacterium]
MKLWDKEAEIQFFQEALRNFASPEQLFYNLKDGYFAYVPKGSNAEGQTLQSRNSLIGQFTEKWSKTLFEPIAKELGLHAVNSVVCDELGLPRQSSADLAFCTTNNTVQKPENIKLLFEIKMSIVSNYKFTHPNHINMLVTINNTKEIQHCYVPTQCSKQLVNQSTFVFQVLLPQKYLLLF